MDQAQELTKKAQITVYIAKWHLKKKKRQPSDKYAIYTCILHPLHRLELLDRIKKVNLTNLSKRKKKKENQRI